MSPHYAAGGFRQVGSSPANSHSGTPLGKSGAGAKDAGDDDGFGTGRTSPVDDEDLRMAGSGIMADALTSVGPGIASPAQRSPAQRSPVASMPSSGGRGMAEEEAQEQEVGAFVMSEKKKKKKKKKKKDAPAPEPAWELTEDRDDAPFVL